MLNPPIPKEFLPTFFRVCSSFKKENPTFTSTYLAAASWELVVISIANCTDFCKASLVLWSTGSTDWISMLVNTRLFCGNRNLSRTFIFSSSPNTDARMILAEFCWWDGKIQKLWKENNKYRYWTRVYNYLWTIFDNLIFALTCLLAKENKYLDKLSWKVVKKDLTAL